MPADQHPMSVEEAEAFLASEEASPVRQTVVGMREYYEQALTQNGWSRGEHAENKALRIILADREAKLAALTPGPGASPREGTWPSGGPPSHPWYRGLREFVDRLLVTNWITDGKPRLMEITVDRGTGHFQVEAAGERNASPGTFVPCDGVELAHDPMVEVRRLREALAVAASRMQMASVDWGIAHATGQDKLMYSDQMSDWSDDAKAALRGTDAAKA